MTTKSDSGVTLVRPPSVAMLCNIVSPFATCNIQGMVCPAFKESQNSPSAVVVAVSSGPVAHLPVTTAPDIAAPVAANPEIVG